MHLLIIDQSVLAYKSYRRLFTQDYEGETDDQEHEFVRQYIHQLVYLLELHKPDHVLFAMDCPRDQVWRHRVVRRFYGPRINAHPIEWPGGTKDKTAENACRWNVECYNSYKTVWIDADGRFRSKQLRKGTFTDWAKEDNEITRMDPVKDVKLLRKILPVVAKMYKDRSDNWPRGAALTKEEFKAKSVKLCRTLAPLFGARVVGADELEADDIAYAAVKRWQYHDITVATVDVDWLILALFVKDGSFKFWDMNKYEFRDTTSEKAKRVFVDKILRGDDSDNIQAMRLKGKKSNIGPKERDRIFDEVPLENMYEWIKEHGDTDSLVRNATLINPEKAPQDLRDRALEALLASAKQLNNKPAVQLSDLVSEATLNLAKVDGQKDRQMKIIRGGNREKD